jgi:hypothetical protein
VTCPSAIGESENPKIRANLRRLSFGPALTRSLRHARQGRPPGLMRRAKTLTGLGVEVLIEEVLIEEERISPVWIVLEAGIWAVRRPPVIRVEQKQAEQTAPERVATRSRFGRVPDPVGNSTVKSSPKKL